MEPIKTIEVVLPVDKFDVVRIYMSIRDESGKLLQMHDTCMRPEMYELLKEYILEVK